MSLFGLITRGQERKRTVNIVMGRCHKEEQSSASWMCL